MVLDDTTLMLMAGAAMGIVALIAYNLYNERQYKKKAERIFHSSMSDPLMQKAVEEPGLSGIELGADVADASIDEHLDGRLEPGYATSGFTLQESRLDVVLDDVESVSLVRTSNPAIYTSFAASAAAVDSIHQPAPAATAMADVDLPLDDLGEQPQPVHDFAEPYAESRYAEPHYAEQNYIATQDASAASPFLLDSEPSEDLLDPVVEFGIAIRFAQAQSPAPFLAVGDATGGRVAYYLNWIGLNAFGWQQLVASDSREFTELRALVQFADRKGPITEAEINAFVQGLSAKLVEFGGEIAPLDLAELTAHAKALDDFCAGVDLQMAVHVMRADGGDFAGTRLRGQLEAAGFAMAADGRFHLLDAHGQTLVTVANTQPRPFAVDTIRNLLTTGVTFWLDVPRVPNGAEAYDKLIDAARHLSHSINGMLVDDQRRPLSAAVLKDIRERIVVIQKKMLTYQLPAGGKRALRLFRG